MSAIGAQAMLFGCHQAEQAPRPQPPRRTNTIPIQTSNRPPQPRPTYHPPPSAPPRHAGPSWFPAGGKISPRWSTIVIHHSATASGDARTFDQFHRSKGWEGLGYHFVIGNGSNSGDGQVEIGSRWHAQKTGAHCKTPSNYYNERGIGICLVGDFTKTRPTRKQLAALEQLTQFLSRQCGISPDRITTHGLINKGTQCPGQNFALAPLRSAVARGSASSYR